MHEGGLTGCWNIMLVGFNLNILMKIDIPTSPYQFSVQLFELKKIHRAREWQGHGKNHWFRWLLLFTCGPNYMKVHKLYCVLPFPVTFFVLVCLVCYTTRKTFFFFWKHSPSNFPSGIVEKYFFNYFPGNKRNFTLAY